MLSSLLNTAYSNLYTLFIGKKYSADNLGYYTRADQFAVFPATTFTDIVSRVAYPLLCKSQGDKKELSRVYTSFIKSSCFLIFPLMIGLSVLAQPIIVVLLTDKWLPAATLMSVLALDGLWAPITRINLNLLQAVGRSDLFLRLEIIKKSISIGILLLTLPYGLFWICIGRFVYSIIALLINMYYTVDIIGKSYIDQIRDWFPNLLVSILMGGVVYVSIFFIASPSLQLIVGLLVGLVSYIILSVIFKLEARIMLLSKIKNLYKH
jgi:O-antigen/teichoic acid export membrane protein